MRLSRRETFLAMAGILAERGTCDRKKVGAIIAIEGRAVSWGYNGAPPGLPHCEENDHGRAVGSPGCRCGQFETRHENNPYGHTVTCHLWGPEVEGCRNATHAEANAIAFAAKQGISTDGATLYTTVAPCDTCTRLVIAAGIVAVEYKEAYRDRSGVELLIAAGVRVASSD